jgi:beta-glucosidase
MSSKEILVGVSLITSSVLLGGCGSSSTTVPPSTAAPSPALPGIPYDPQKLIDTFGNDASFLWGSATAAAQIEGAWNIDGKQPSIWDDFCHSIRANDTTDDPFHKQCGNVPTGANKTLFTTLDITDDFYHKYEADLDLLSSYNMNALRISFSWPRLMPFNPVTGQHEKNAEGVQFYKNVLKKMSENGITPVVTLFHWDLPNDLSFLQENVVDEFVKYATMVFAEFHDDVKDWATFNEPTSTCSLGYAIGAFAPGHKSTTDHLKCGKNLLMAHAGAVKVFRDQGYEGQIGIVLDYKWAYPDDENDPEAIEMAQWDRDNVVGFWADPIFKTGDFPESLKTFFGDGLPTLTTDEQALLLNSADFWGANTYGGKLTNKTAYSQTLGDYVPGNDMAERYSFCPCNPGMNTSHVDNMAFECGAASGWLWAKPDSMYQYLHYIDTNYGKPKIYVTEFGCDVEGESDMEKSVALVDTFRLDYYQLYMMQIEKAKSEGVDIQGVFAWSLMDNFEWGDGLDFRFGITYVDFNDADLTRTPKDSAKWWQGLIGDMNPSSVTV